MARDGIDWKQLLRVRCISRRAQSHAVHLAFSRDRASYARCKGPGWLLGRGAAIAAALLLQAAGSGDHRGCAQERRWQHEERA